MLGELHFQKLLEDPLYDLPQELGVVEQDLLHQLQALPTMGVGHRNISRSDRVHAELRSSWKTVAASSSGSPIYRSLRTQPAGATTHHHNPHPYKPHDETQAKNSP